MVTFDFETLVLFFLGFMTVVLIVIAVTCMLMLWSMPAEAESRGDIIVIDASTGTVTRAKETTAKTEKTEHKE